MQVAFIAVTLVAIVINAAESVANFARIPFVKANAAAVGVPESWLPGLGLAKGAGALGLAAGLAGLQPVGVAAAAGLVLFFVCALVAHIRAKVYYNIAGPIFFLVFSIAALALMIAH
ncbi:DoxX family protein [Nocardia uniformis]|uniref:DoxX family protein n=1 Tax=Nocardia uniformis TaxID=53432 RepID=A0A849BUA1_9NOCA|nr:DoxX family protein [Nocardia uniformis]NNH70192.1 DoxX family protein [Nocardia uniformis]